MTREKDKKPHLKIVKKEPVNSLKNEDVEEHDHGFIPTYIETLNNEGDPVLDFQPKDYWLTGSDDYGEDVEICRLTHQSTFGDETSIRCFLKDPIHFYYLQDGEGLFEYKFPKPSYETLSMRNLIETIEKSSLENYPLGLVLTHLDYLVKENKKNDNFFSYERIFDFVRVDSDFYSDIHNYYEDLKRSFLEKNFKGEIPSPTSSQFMNQDLLNKYKKFFGDEPPFPPEHIMETLVEMKEKDTYDEMMDQIKPEMDDIVDEVEKVSGEKMSLDHPLFDIDFRKKQKKDN